MIRSYHGETKRPKRDRGSQFHLPSLPASATQRPKLLQRGEVALRPPFFMPSRNPLQSKLIAIIEPVLEASGYELVDLRFTLEQGGWILRVCADLPLDARGDAPVAEVPEDRVDLSDC